MNYNLDLERLSVQSYKEILKGQNLLPGRKILMQDIDEKFAFFEKRVKSSLPCERLVQSIL